MQTNLVTYNPEKIAKAIFEAHTVIDSICNGVMALPWDEKPREEKQIEVALATKLLLVSAPDNYLITGKLAFDMCNEVMEDDDLGEFPDTNEVLSMFEIYAVLFNLIMKDKS